MTDKAASLPADRQPMRLPSVSLAVFSTALWGGTAVSNQFALDVMPPLLLGAARFGLAALFMVVWCRWMGAPLWPRREDWLPATVLGLLLFVQIGTFNLGTDRSTTSHASILVNTFIFWVTAYEALIARTFRMRWWQGLGLLLAAGGATSLFAGTLLGPASHSGRDTPTLTGDLILAFSGLMFAVKTIYTKHAVRTGSPATLILWHDVIGTLLFVLVNLSLGERPTGQMTTPAVVAILYNGFVVSGFCFAVNAHLLQRHGASQVSVFSFLTPVFGVSLGILLRGDQLSLTVFLAGALVASGIALVNRGGGEG